PVASVFVMDRFVTITKFPDADWPLIKARLVAAIETTAAPAATGGADATPGSTDEKLALINAVIDENVRPALAGDGGGLEVLEFSDNVLTVHYQGACGSCASATSGTLYAIQNLLQRMVDPKIQVVSV
ncbi:MAG TPA: NifU family protein, partial [Elusimicrobiota bacterium]|nr:NifU family protein [Elusimicrobiota bacterium]